MGKHNDAETERIKTEIISPKRDLSLLDTVVLLN